MSRPVWLLALLTSGCTYVTQAAFEARRAELDEDGDKVPWADDCDDQDPSKSPKTPETPYDGIDNDCDGEDAVDVDGDGFPGIDQASYEALDPQVPYPDDMVGKDIDCADDPAVFPEAGDVYPDPTGSIEVQYDGVDGDCQGDNDFDVDGDGYMPDTVEIDGVEVPTDDALATYTTEWQIPADVVATWAPPGQVGPLLGDCDDTDPEVNPQATIPEVPYDGVDRNCDDLNDFDQDGDHFMPPEAEALYAAYVARYYGTDAPPFEVDPDQPFDDCLDELDPDFGVFPSGAPVDPSTVHPDTATFPSDDTPYDAIDADCARDNDFDADGDGFVPDTVSGSLTLDVMDAYAATWGFDAATVASWVAGNPDAGLTEPADGDCDDARFDTWPGALEILGDGADQDCDGGVDTTPFGFGDANGDFDWTNPTNPEVARLGDTYVVLVGAEVGFVPSLFQEIGVAFPFPVDVARGGSPPSGSYPNWKAPTANLQIQGLLDIAVLPNPEDVDGDGIVDPTLHTVSNSDNAGTGYSYMNVNGIRLNSLTGSLLSTGGASDFVTTPYTASAIDMVIDGDGEPFSLACAPGRLHAVYSADFTPPHLSITTAGGDACFFEGEPYLVGGDWIANFTLCEGGPCEAWSLSEQPLFVDGGANGEDWAWGDQDEGYVSLIDTAGYGFVRDVAGGGPDIAAFPLGTVDALDVSVYDGTVYMAGITGGDVWLQFGTVGSFDYLQLPFDDPSVTGEVPRGVAIWADADRIAVAVSATTGVASLDSVGWVFLAPPP